MMKYSFRSCAGLSTCDGPQFWAVPVVPCAQATIGRPSFGAGPVGDTSKAVETVGFSPTSDEMKAIRQASAPGTDVATASCAITWPSLPSTGSFVTAS